MIVALFNTTINQRTNDLYVTAGYYRTILLTVILLFTTIFLTSCGPDYLMQEDRELTGESWNYADSQSFSFNIKDTQQLYALHLIVDHSVDFFAQNVYVNVKTTFPGGEELEEAVSLQLADKFGQWFGSCSGEQCRLDIPIQPIAFFEQAGNYTIEVAQHSREKNLEGIHGIGFAVEILDTER